MTMKISQKGWVAIPADLRKKYDLKPGDEIHVIDFGGVLSLIPAHEDPIRIAEGMLKGDPSVIQTLMEERQMERVRERLVKSKRRHTGREGDGGELAMSSMTVRVQKRGLITIPVELREKHDIEEGDVFSILDLGGVFVLSPGTSEVEKLSREIRKLMAAKGVTLQELLDGLTEERERYYLEHYGQEQSE